MKTKSMYSADFKSWYLMLLVCLTLFMGAISCSNEEVGNVFPEESKQLSKEEVIELMLSKTIHTRGVYPIPIMMITSNKTVRLRGFAKEEMTINWNGEKTTEISSGTSFDENYTFLSDQSLYGIFLEGSEEALTSLDVSDNGLTDLDISYNVNLTYLDCRWNHLNELDLTGCLNLNTLWVDYNNLSTLDVSHLVYLESLLLKTNRLNQIDLSNNTDLETLDISYNSITNVDLSHNPKLSYIAMRALPIEKINNSPINSTSFSTFPQLGLLDISYTPFTSIDFSKNPATIGIIIEGTEITQLDISNLQVDFLIANYSKLQNIICTYKNLSNLCDLGLWNTPLATNSNTFRLLTMLPDKTTPDRYGRIISGRLWINSSEKLNALLSDLKRKDWNILQYQ